MDVVYPYKRTVDEFELRYSLRSLANVPHRRVIIAGDRAKLARPNVVAVRAPRIRDRYLSSRTNILAAIEKAGIAGRFVVMNDDFFVLRPWKPRTEHRGPIAQYLASSRVAGEYREMVERTADLLRLNGVADPLFFGLHTPAVFDAERLVEMVARFEGERYLTRTLYGNLYGEPGTFRKDVKVRDWPAPLPGDVFSTCDRTVRDPACRAWLKANFPTPSPYERRDARNPTNARRAA